MKRTNTVGILLLLSLFTFAQPLQQGVFTTKILLSDTLPCIYASDTCPNYEISLNNTIVPYVTGMNLYLKIDSIIGPNDSIQIFAWPNFVNTTYRANDTIPFHGTFSIYIYFYGWDTLLASIIAIGTPQIAGENYFCRQIIYAGVNVDGCFYLFHGIAAGDTAKNCSVLSNVTGVLNLGKGEPISISPNPFTNQINITTERTFQFTICDYMGRVVMQGESDKTLATEALASGSYILTIKNEELLSVKKMVKY